MNRRMIEYNGASHCLKKWAEINKLSLSTIKYRLYVAKWNPVKAITTPPEVKRKCDEDCDKCEHEGCIKISIPRPLTAAQRIRVNKYKRELYYKHKAEGICVRCGTRKATHGVNCLECWIKLQRSNKKRWNTGKRAYWEAHDLCYFCGKPRAGGYKVCEEHLKLARINGKKGAQTEKARQAFEKHKAESYKMFLAKNKEI